MKRIIPLFLALLLCGCAAEETLATEPVTQATAVTEAPTEAPTDAPTEPQPEVFTLTFLGDCTLGSAPSQYTLPSSFISRVGEDMDYPFRNVLTYLENDDATFANLEGVFCDSGYAADKLFTFRAPERYVNILTRGSIEAVTLANNHSRDYGQKGYDTTRALLEENGIPYAQRDGSCLFTTESGLTVGIYACLYNIDFKDLETEVAALREQGAEIVVFALHWGQEGVYRPLDHQIQQAYKAIDAGVDIVWGHHPHVLQKIETYGDGIIFYSLGNFVFGGNHEPSDMDTALLRQQVIREPDGTVHLGDLEIIPASISSIPRWNDFCPTPYEPGTEEYDRVISKLDGTFTGPNLYVPYA